MQITVVRFQSLLSFLQKTATLRPTTQSPRFVVQPRSLSGAIVVRFESRFPSARRDATSARSCDVNRRQSSDPRRSLRRGPNASYA